MQRLIMPVTAALLISCSDTRSSVLFSNAPESLYATGLYQDQNSQTINSYVHLYKPSAELWSDGASKRRWVFIPEVTQIDTNDINHWVFPVGTKFWKEFSHLGKKIETRYIEKISDGNDASSWKFATYQWNEAGTDALRAPDAGVKDASRTEFGVTHDIPSTTQCALCHRMSAEPVLGFDALLLNGEGEGLRSRDLIEQRLVTQNFDASADIPSTDTTTVSALKYLHTNCGNCHNPEGRAGRMTELYFKHDMNAISLEQSPTYVTAVNTATHYYRLPGTVADIASLNIKPKDPSQSAVFVRMEVRTPAGSMPPLGSKIPDRTGLQLIREWILTL